MYVVAIAVATLTSCSSIKNMAVPTMDTAISMAAKQGTVSDEQFNHWAHADLETDTIPGMSLDKAYQFLEGKTGETVIVAVIDSGIDIEHEDLKDVLWTNPKEIAGNNIDDDKNGYVDDIYGWNFLGGNGVAAPEQLEITRIVAKLNSRFEGKTAESISEEEKADFEKYQEYLESYTTASKNHFNTMARLDQIEGVMNSVKEFIGKETLTLEDLKALKTDDVAIQGQANGLIGMFSNGFDEKAFNSYYDNLKNNKNYDLDFDGRAIVGDKPEDITDVNYGNGFVIGSKDVESHGTHVAGIILASRNNGLGMHGVAHNAKLMSVRAVPDGDERDKDVALAIRYAVDNGAKVVNMSFGKSYSPHRHWVIDAIKYAEKHDVLLVHAAGNSSEDIDVKDNWPNDSYDKINEVADNVLTIGAMSVNYNEALPAGFTNYGKLNVDVFAPGVKIYASTPNNEYQFLQGTSMASPAVAGIATLIMSQYPKLTAAQVKQIILDSGLPLKTKVIVAGNYYDIRPFETLSSSGKIVNAYNALILADSVSKSN